MTDVGEGDVPDDYSPGDGVTEDGVDVCPHCGMELHPDFGHAGTVYHQDGTRSENIATTDPFDRPFFCPECYADLDAERRARDHKTLDEFEETVSENSAP